MMQSKRRINDIQLDRKLSKGFGKTAMSFYKTPARGSIGDFSTPGRTAEGFYKHNSEIGILDLSVTKQSLSTISKPNYRSNCKVRHRDSLPSELTVSWQGSKDSTKSKKSPTAAEMLLKTTNVFKIRPHGTIARPTRINNMISGLTNQEVTVGKNKVEGLDPNQLKL